MNQYKKIAHGIHGQSKRLIQRVYTYYYLTIDDFLIFVLVVISKSGEYSGIKPFNVSIILDVLYDLAEEIQPQEKEKNIEEKNDVESNNNLKEESKKLKETENTDTEEDKVEATKTTDSSQSESETKTDEKQS